MTSGELYLFQVFPIKAHNFMHKSIKHFFSVVFIFQQVLQVTVLHFTHLKSDHVKQAFVLNYDLFLISRTSHMLLCNSLQPWNKCTIVERALGVCISVVGFCQRSLSESKSNRDAALHWHSETPVSSIYLAPQNVQGDLISVGQEEIVSPIITHHAHEKCSDYDSPTITP